MEGEDSFNPSRKAKKIFDSERQLLKQATTYKKEKNYDKAIECIRQAYELANKHQIGKPLNSLTRLPNCLLLAKRKAEAWDEYHNVANLKYCYWYKSNPHSVYGIKSDAYLRLSLMLKKDGYFAQALAYGLGSYVAQRGFDYLHHQDMKQMNQKPGRWKADEGLAEEIDNLMIDSSKKDKDHVSSLIKEHLKSLPNVEPEKIIELIYEMTGTENPNYEMV